MFTDRENTGEATSQERRDAAQPTRRVLGHVVQCDGARAIVAAEADFEDGSVTGLWTVGKMISINLGSVRTVGLVYSIIKSDRQWSSDSRNTIEVNVELIGEVRDDPTVGKPVFDRGVTNYPHIGAIAHRIRARDLAAVPHTARRRPRPVGPASKSESTPA